MVKGSAEDELEQFFEVLNSAESNALPVTKSAFTQARKKFSHTAFIELNQKLNQFEGAQGRRWQGFRLYAVDGSIINLPEKIALREHFDPDNKNHPQARASQLYDVLNHTTVDAELTPISVDERTLAARHLQHTQKNDLVIYDRGYPAFYLFALHREQGTDFCARVAINLYNETRDFWLSGKREERVTLHPAKAAIQKCRDLGVSAEPLCVRLIRVELPGEEPEILISSVLEEEVIACEDFKELYHLRWGVEEDYKVMKSRLEVEQFSGLSVQAIQQDFHAKIFSKNLTSLLVNEAQRLVDTQKAHCKLSYKVNFTRALSRMKHGIVRLLTCTNIRCQLKRLIELMATSVEAVRPDRSYARRKARGPKHSVNYKRAR